ncbi:DUF881 domain-containing protein [Aeromicrobium sp. Root344]|uniref:DUF881 domain-containing protein n=1 Tax=Aeromicrobium sp. Root344 TaxID=1736521 RepID=UPI0009E72006|nr:DUF881 domain-containing protein [Aeromicrobium sp. Root344]
MAKAGSHARQSRPVAVLAIFVFIGLLFAAGKVSANGGDLRPAGGDPASLAQERAQRIDERRSDARHLRADIEDLSASVSSATVKKLRARAKALEEPTGLTALEGPGIRVTLDDAPPGVKPPDGTDPKVLLVHQQDIQAYVNALWAGGAEAVTLQGQRLISTTGIKCVGATVVLDGVPYFPPYVIEAIGDVGTMNSAIATSSATTSYAQYAADPRYQLGLDIEDVDNVKAPAYAGTVSLSYAKATD